MTTLRKSWWALALAFPLAAFTVGCSTEEGSVEVSPGPEMNNPPAPVTPLDKEAPPATTPAEEPKAEAPKAEEPKAEAPKAEEPKAEAPKAEAPALEAPKGASTVKFSEEQLAEIKTLPEADQAIALKQAICPVSEETLGDMGAPVKVMAEGQTVFVCCKSCTKEVEADPKAILAKLGLKK
ncbi:MAG: hypothetical protein AB7I30_04110 [Isosphaeraceae bacterium]